MLINERVVGLDSLSILSLRLQVGTNIMIILMAKGALIFNLRLDLILRSTACICGDSDKFFQQWRFD